MVSRYHLLRWYLDQRKYQKVVRICWWSRFSAFLFRVWRLGECILRCLKQVEVLWPMSHELYYVLFCYCFSHNWRCDLHRCCVFDHNYILKGCLCCKLKGIIFVWGQYQRTSWVVGCWGYCSTSQLKGRMFVGIGSLGVDVCVLGRYAWWCCKWFFWVHLRNVLWFLNVYYYVIDGVGSVGFVRWLGIWVGRQFLLCVVRGCENIVDRLIVGLFVGWKGTR